MQWQQTAAAQLVCVIYATLVAIQVAARPPAVQHRAAAATNRAHPPIQPKGRPTRRPFLFPAALGNDRTDFLLRVLLSPDEKVSQHFTDTTHVNFAWAFKNVAMPQ